MEQTEKELMAEKFKGIIAMITTNNDISKIYHKELLESQKRILNQVTITNNRVTIIEKQTKVIRFLEDHPKITIVLLLGISFLLASFDLKDLISFFKP